MKFIVKQKYATIVALLEGGKMVKMIHMTLKQLRINEQFVFCTLEHNKKMDDIVDSPQEGHQKAYTI